MVDEVLAVGDAEFQRKAVGKMQDVAKGEGRTVLFVSHNMGSMQQLCRKGVLLENGSVAFSGIMGEDKCLSKRYCYAAGIYKYGWRSQRASAVVCFD